MFYRNFMLGSALAAFAAALPVPAHSQDAAAAPDLALHGQATLVVQGDTAFPSPYQGPNSLAPDQVRETVDVTLYAGVRPWRGAEIWANPEIDQGFGLSDTLGAAGFPSAEAYKVGKSAPYLRLQRLFLRQTFALGGTAEAVGGAANQFAGARSADRLVITLGKFSVGDLFDTNALAHDPRGDFLNWSLVDAGSFDYAADAWGYSTGVAAELYRRDWTLRLGVFNLSKVPNGETLEQGLGQSQLVGEIERRYQLAGNAGTLRLTVFRNRGRFARYSDALALAATTGTTPDLAPARRPATRMGASVNLEQTLTSSLGLFVRAGFANGSIEPYDFTDIDRTLSGGLVLSGRRWGRDGDRIGLGAARNDISAEHRRFLAAGGLGVLVGDGALPRPGPETVFEGWYSLALARYAALTLDAQLIANPGYNRDRGPAPVVAARWHAQF